MASRKKALSELSRLSMSQTSSAGLAFSALRSRSGALGGGAAVALSELWMAMCDEAPPAADGDEAGTSAPPSVASLSSLSVSVSQPARRGAARGGATPRSSAVNSSTSAAAGGYAPSASAASYSSLHSRRSRGAPAVRVQKVRLEKMLEAPAEGEGDADVPVVTLAL